MRRLSLCALLVLSLSILLGMLPEQPAAGAAIYWAQQGGIWRANLDGSQPREVVPGLFVPAGLAVDAPAGKMYWADIWPLGSPLPGGRIERANLDGTRLETLVAELPEPTAVAVAPALGKVYWTDTSALEIHRVNLDGSLPETLVGHMLPSAGIAIDEPGAKMVWTRTTFTPGDSALMRADLDGANREPLVPAMDGPSTAVAVDPSGKIYFSYLNPYIDGLFPSSIMQCGPDGSGLEPVVSGLFQPQGLALDLSAGKVYWTDITAIDGVPGQFLGAISRANLDGSQREVLLQDLHTPRGIVIVPEPASLVLAVVGGLMLLLTRGSRGSAKGRKREE